MSKKSEENVEVLQTLLSSQKYSLDYVQFGFDNPPENDLPQSFKRFP